MHALKLKIPPAAVFLICVAGMWLLARAFPVGDFELRYAGFLAIAIAVPGLVVAIAGLRAFRRHGTTANPIRPDEASSIVSGGVYRYTRNPMYVGLACCVLAWGLYLQNLAAVLGVVVFIAYLTHFQIKPEERALQEKFGDEYASFKSRVRRWL
jgi:protein-S-isoprenylcysteine O-methyltransferase Ste14